MAKIKKLKIKEQRHWKDYFWMFFLGFAVIFSVAVTIYGNTAGNKSYPVVARILKKEIIEAQPAQYLPQYRENDLTHQFTVSIRGQECSYLVDNATYEKFNEGNTVEVTYKITVGGKLRALNYFEPVEKQNK